MKFKKFRSISFVLVFSLLIMIINPLQVFALDANKMVATTAPVTNIIMTDQFIDSSNQRNNVRYLKLRVMLTDSYREDFENPERESTTRVAYADIPFISTWSIGFDESFVYAGPFAVDSCNLDISSFCNDLNCGSNCNNDIDNLIHHKNAIKNLNQVKTYISDGGYDIMLTLSATPMCGVWDTHIAGVLGVTYLDDNYTFVRNSTAMTPNNRVRVMQHEISHMFGCIDGVCATGERCVMSGGYDGITLYTENIWCSSCLAYFDSDTH